MKEYFTDSQGRIRYTGGSNSTINNYGTHPKIRSSGNFNKNKKITLNTFEKKIKNNYNYIGTKIYQTSCPICSSAVYFCNCSNGGKVFFDSLSPEWDKHPCTNNNFRIPSADYYIYVSFTSFFIDSFIFDKEINGIKKFKIPTYGNKIFKNNIMNNIIIFIRPEIDNYVLKLVISRGKYQNHILIENKNFNNFIHLLSFIIYILSKKDFSLDINIDYKDKNFPLINEKEFEIVSSYKKKKS